METNRIAPKKNHYKIEPYKGCQTFGILKIKKDKGYLEYFHKDPATNVVSKINSDTFESYNSNLMNHIIQTAKLLCSCTYKTLWSY